ncbi:MAG: hypothetical protein AB7V48_05100 [Sedimentibacter sp.]
MNKLKYKLIPQTSGDEIGIHVPLNIAFVNLDDIKKCNISSREAVKLIAGTLDGPVGINVIDMDCVTTTSDGIMTEGTVVLMAAGDRGKINPDFGILEMEEIPFSDEIIMEEPHLKQWEMYPGKKLFRGPDPKKKIIPVHNVVITGRAGNNNSATEMMNIVTMEEILLPILGQIEIINDGNVVVGNTGEVISVGIGMTIAEKFGRIFPTRQYKPGDTAHGSGEYAKTLKRHIPIIAADKAVIASKTIKALHHGMVPGKDIGCSPLVLSIAKAMGFEIAFDNITERAYEELASVGITKEWLNENGELLTAEEVISRADEIIPGINSPIKYKATEIAKVKYVDVE